MIRTLKAEEYQRLKDVADGYTPDPKSSIAIVDEEENGQIVGRMLLVCLTHVEGTWVREDKRNSRRALRMMQKTIEEAKNNGLTQLLAYTDETDQKVSKYMRFLGFQRLPISVWNKAI